jgi:hypothetical protein
MIVRVLERKFRDRKFLALPKACRILGGPLDETLLERLEARRQQEDVRPVIADSRADLEGALDVDLDDRVIAGPSRR